MLAEPNPRWRTSVLAGNVLFYAIFLNTSAEFLEPNPTQLQIAYSISALRPLSGT